MNILIEAAQTLEKAAAVIEEQGWCQEMLQATTGEVCVFGSILVAEGFSTDEQEEIKWEDNDASSLHKSIIDALIREIYPKGAPKSGAAFHRAGLISSNWNDRDGQTAYNVTTTMRSAAQRLYKEGTP